jgi:tight adherence protein C
VTPALPTVEPRVVLWSALVGLGLYLIVTAQPIGRPKPDLAARLRRLDVDLRIRDELGRRDAAPLFRSRLLEAMLRPVVDDAGRLLGAVLGRFGLASGAELERKLALARPGVGPVQFFGEKLVTSLLGLGLPPLLNALGVQPFGPWPAWSWAAACLVGFLAPDWQLDRRVAARRAACLMELPTVLDLLVIATSAGLAIEQALVQVARQGSGTVAAEIGLALRETSLGQRPLIEALGAMAARNGVPELTRFADQLRAAHEQGVPLVEALATQADALRERKHLRIVEEGGKAGVRMVLPVALFILPVLFVVLLVPAAVQLLRLGG